MSIILEFIYDNNFLLQKFGYQTKFNVQNNILASYLFSIVNMFWLVVQLLHMSHLSLVKEAVHAGLL